MILSKNACRLHGVDAGAYLSLCRQTTALFLSDLRWSFQAMPVIKRYADLCTNLIVGIIQS